jgi:tetratricopeptide (TPR) repeat protein
MKYLRSEFLKGYLLICLFMLTASDAHSCMNEYRVLLNGNVHFGEERYVVPYARYDLDDKRVILEEIHEADSIYTLTGKTEDYSDLGTLHAYNGQFMKAKKIFLEIERRSPGLYITAANLGTVYELLGQNDSALYWIKKAIAINPDSHKGSEWIHEKILEAKMRANGDENYLRTYSILNLDFGDQKIPENKNELDLEKLGPQLLSQLRERMSFVKPKDPVVAQLLFDLGNVNSILYDVSSAVPVYKLAEEYGYSSEVFEKRQSYFKRMQIKAELMNWILVGPGYMVLTLVIFFTMIVAVAVIVIRRRRRVRMKKQTAGFNIK